MSNMICVTYNDESMSNMTSVTHNKEFVEYDLSIIRRMILVD